MHTRISFPSLFVALFFYLFFVSDMAFAQNDTIYYNSKWVPTTIKDSASFYRPPIKKEGDLFKVRDYYMSGQLQMNALSKSSEKDVWEGNVTWYNEDGSLFQQGNYKNNRLEGDFVTVMNGEQLISKYKNGYIISGKQNMIISGRNMYTEYIGDTIKTVIYDKNLKGIRHERYGTKDNYEVYSKYYGANGKFLGKKQVLASGNIKGIEVFYCYNPMQVQEVRYYKNGRMLSNTTYHSNGQIRELFEQKPEYSKTYYNRVGEQIGKVNYLMDRDYLKPQDGTEFFFFYDKKGGINSAIQTVRRYKNGLLLDEEMRYENQVVKNKITYKDGGKELMLSFDENGNQIARMRYNNYMPIEGKEIFKDRTTTYVDGKLVEEVNFYYDTNIISSVKTPSSETYYDKAGELLGTLKLDIKESYPKPLEGKRYFVSHDGDITSIEEYKNGFVTERTSFRKRTVEKNKTVEFKRIEEYRPDSFDRIKETCFYSNGNKQSEISYLSYKEIEGSFYDIDGQLLGTYDYEKKEGIRYDFFRDSDEVQVMEERKDGKQVRLKRYNYGPNQIYGQINPVLEEDIDISCCAKFYNRDGKLLAEFTFKDSLPWEGTVYDHSARTKYTLKEGAREGIYQKFDYDESILEEGQYADDKEDGVFRFYNYQGELLRKEQFKQGKLEGEATYFDTNGEVMARMLYKNGLPWEGKRVLVVYGNKKPNQETYKEGVITQRVSYDDIGKRITKFQDGKEAQTIAYYEDSSKKRLSYEVKDGYLSGLVVRYDENGKEQHTGTFEKGKLTKGAVFLTPSGGSNDLAYISLRRNENSTVVELIDTENNIVFKGEEFSSEGSYRNRYLDNLNIYIDYLEPNRLY